MTAAIKPKIAKLGIKEAPLFMEHVTVAGAVVQGARPRPPKSLLPAAVVIAVLSPVISAAAKAEQSAAWAAELNMTV